MNNSKSSKLGASKIVLQITSVSVSSGGQGEETDMKAIHFLQDVGFIRHKYDTQRNRATAHTPGEDLIFLLEYDASFDSNEEPFHLVCVKSGVRTEIENGHTVSIGKIADSVGFINVSLAGHYLADWEVVCKVVGFKGEEKEVVKQVVPTPSEPDPLPPFPSPTPYHWRHPTPSLVKPPVAQTPPPPPKDTSLTEATRLAEKIHRHLETIELHLLALNEISSDKWRRFIDYRGAERLAKDLVSLTKMMKDIDEVKRRIYRIRAKTSS